MLRRYLAHLVLLATAALVSAVGSALDATNGGKPESDDRDKKTFGGSLAHTSPEALKGQSKLAPANTATCINANTQCLLACPSTEGSAEFFCSNHCRAKLNICKARVKHPPPPRGG
jgi:hypothetical protein